MLDLRGRAASALAGRAQARGFSLVESLVALLVLSIGLLGIAGLFVGSVRNSRTALLRTQAVSLVADMADRIRANATAGAAYQLANTASAPADADCAPTDASAGGNCTPAQLAQDDIARWVAAVRFALPATDNGPPGARIVHFDGNSALPERFQISVSWREPGEQADYTYASEVQIIPRGPAT